MNYLALVDETWKLCGLSGDGPADVETAIGMQMRVAKWVARAWSFIQDQEHNWSFMWHRHEVALATGTNSWTDEQLHMPDFGYLLRMVVLPPKYLFDEDWRQEMTYDEAPDLLDYRNVEPGKPTKATRTPEGVWLMDREPDEAYEMYIEYYRRKQELKVNDDLPHLPIEFAYLICYKAQEYYALYDEDASMLQEAVTNYKSLLQRLQMKCLPPVRWAASGFDE